jgi:vanillate/3-O-methylgallate O-demethylase
MSWKESCYIGDWSFLWEHHYRGPDAMRLFSDISCASLKKFDIGQCKHVIHTNDDGKVIHEGILARLGEEHLLLFGRGGFWANYNLSKGGYEVSSTRDDWFNIQVSGPRSIYLLEEVCGQSLREMGFMRLKTVLMAGREVTLMRQNMAGEIGFELVAPAQYRDDVYNAVVQAGAKHGLRKLGGRAVFINHLEACFPTIITDYLPAMFSPDMSDYLAYFKANMPSFAITFNINGSLEGKELSDYYRSPVELGWGKVVNLDHDFKGKEALAKELANPKRHMVTLVWNSKDVIDIYASLFEKGDHYDFMDMPRDQRGYVYFDQVVKDGKLVGTSSSRGYSYYFREMLSLCCLDVEWAKPGTEVEVVWGEPGHRQKIVRAKVAPAPYKTDRRKADLKALPPIWQPE